MVSPAWSEIRFFGVWMVGLDVFMDAKTQLDDVVVLSAGWAYKLPADELRRQYRRGGSLQKFLLRFTDALLAQVAQGAICGRMTPSVSVVAEDALKQSSRPWCRDARRLHIRDGARIRRCFRRPAAGFT